MDAKDLDHALSTDAKRVEAFAHLAIEFVDGSLQPVSLSEVKLEEEAVVPHHRPVQGVRDRLPRYLDALVDEQHELGGIGLAPHARIEDRPAALPHDVGEHRAELEVRVLT
jgi:hypothetical protein